MGICQAQFTSKGQPVRGPCCFSDSAPAFKNSAAITAKDVCLSSKVAITQSNGFSLWNPLQCCCARCNCRNLRQESPVQGGRVAILELMQQAELRNFLSACGLSPEALERMALAAASRSAAAAKDRCLPWALEGIC